MTIDISLKIWIIHENPTEDKIFEIQILLSSFGIPDDYWLEYEQRKKIKKFGSCANAQNLNEQADGINFEYELKWNSTASVNSRF